MKAVYFAWVRERVGLAQEEIDPPAEIVTVGELIGWLAARSENHAHAFERASVVRVAIDRAHVKPSAKIAGAREIAFFPPMTGG